jgi:hypothetical protein
MPGADTPERERGRTALAAILEDPALGARAAWALALDAYAGGDTIAGDRWTERVRRAPAPSSTRLVPLLDAARHAERGRWNEALAASAPALAFDSAGYAPDPFLRSALHVLRGEWLERLHRPAEADRAWLWYENLDVRGWPSAEAQPAEVDWALATEVRTRRARLALEAGPSSFGCALAERAREIWSAVEPGLEGWVRDLDRLRRRCPE